VKPSRSLFIDVRGLRYHCRIWGNEGAPRLFLLHGWMDCSASFQFLVDELRADRCAVAPDWRGFGLTQWSGGDAYWYQDYLADLDAILRHFQPGAPVDLVGHSMGGNVAAHYAGTRPERIRKFVNLEGFGLANTDLRDAPVRYSQWLDEMATDTRFNDYESFDALAERLRRNNPRLTTEKAQFLARHWGRQDSAGRVVLQMDPAHRRTNPARFRLDEAMAVWRNVEAPVLWVRGEQSENFARHRITPEDYAARRGCFRNRTERSLADAGHMLHHDQPEQVARLIDEFLQ
jgi:pimeloyl-ACP methyl ester carboxylesterase